MNNTKSLLLILFLIPEPLWAAVERPSPPWVLIGVLFLALTALAMVSALYWRARKLPQSTLLAQLYFEVVQNSSNAVYAKDLKGRYLMLNKAALAQLGQPIENLIGKTDTEISGELLGSKIAGEDRQALAQDKSLFFEDKIEFQGARRWFVTNRFPLKDPKGEAFGVCGISVEITAPMRIQEEIENRERSFQHLFERHGAMMWLIDPNNWQVVMANEAAQEFFGVDAENILKCTLTQFSNSSEAELREHLGEVLSAGRATFAGVFKSGSGELRTLRSRASLIEFGQRQLIFSIMSDITVHQKNQESLVESEARFSLLSRVTFEPILIFEDGKLTDLNLAAERFFRSPIEELKGSSFLELFPKAEALVPGQKMDLSGEQEGQFYFWELTPESMFHQGKEKTVVALNDLTQIKKGQAELEANHRYLQLLIEVIPAPFFHKSPSGLLVNCNRAFLELLGKNRGECIGQSMATLLPPSVVARVEEEEAKLSQNEPAQSFEMELSLGTQRQLLCSHAQLYNTQGSFQGVVGVMFDITQRKQALLELEKTQSRLDRVIQGSRDGIWEWELAGPSFYFSPRFLELLELEEIPSGTESWAQILPSAEFNKATKVITEDMALGKNEVEHLMEIPLRSGQSRWLRLRGAVSYDAKGKPVRLSGVLGDLTPFKEAEARLEEAKQKAETAALAKAEFLTNMSHEIRTPMNAVLGFAELLATEIEDPIHQGYLSSIKKGGQSLLTLINDILDLSRFEAGKLQLRLESVNTRELFKDVADIFGPKFSQKGLWLKLELDPDLPSWIVVDDVRLRQILFNLVGNAVKFTEQGGVRLAVKARQKDQVMLSCELVISVIDTGIGIDSLDRNFLFEAFAQAPTGRPKAAEGTGLGLAITEKLVHIMGGQIEVESQPGQGSRFTVVLPGVNIGKKMSHTEIEGQIQSYPQRFQPAEILIVDDIETNRLLVKEALKHSGLNCREAENGQQALILSEALVPDLILMDLRMPVLGGEEAATQIRANSRLKGIPLVAMTASIMGRPERLLENGLFDEILHKPIRFDRLFITLARFLKAKVEPEVAKGPSFLEAPTKNPGTRALNRLKPLENSYPSVLEGQNFDQIAQFGRRITEIAFDLGIKPLEDYGRNLLFLVQVFEIGQLNIRLKEFPLIMAKLREAP
ncbi:MAG: hypothetical protein A2527_00325 [Candidatus Lambdaproteobacteria bacterium RIFOXYD2_FULL_50_16]|uniref:histidine kinase n=1 Tax=Candidatus Lambdaproteobacteria bacterium RIFOXYD2_FULL_50_16 TaxID=1817772 RepID=A0A1F6GFJ0_9PROT|nr:MAG: hypothetical protein A2527_00325 [Candidatus Lambdaproteobacteria bacterium RIFOXYD2_FULL_50_16]